MARDFWSMAKGPSCGSNKTTTQERRTVEVNNHQFKDSIGGDSSNYKENQNENRR